MATTAEMLESIRPKWGDEDELDGLSRGLSEITTEAEPAPDGSIRKTVVEYKVNDKGQKVKVIKKIRLYKTKIKINKKVEERRKWRKFGEPAHSPPGPERGITSVGDEIFIEITSAPGEKPEKTVKPGTKDAVGSIGIVCRNCGKTGDHWTLKCPYFKDNIRAGVPPPSAADEKSPSLPSGSGGTTERYQTPAARRAAAGLGASGSSDRDLGDRRRDETATIRVTNLSEDTKEADLSELFRTFGPISRIYLAKDKITGLSKGFAFINFVHREDAARAIEKLSGFGYDHLILHLEWAKPSTK